MVSFEARMMLNFFIPSFIAVSLKTCLLTAFWDEQMLAARKAKQNPCFLLYSSFVPWRTQVCVHVCHRNIGKM